MLSVIESLHVLQMRNITRYWKIGDCKYHKRTLLYGKKAKKLKAKQLQFITEWWETSYDKYITGNNFLGCDTNLFI